MSEHEIDWYEAAKARTEEALVRVERTMKELIAALDRAENTAKRIAWQLEN